MCHSPIGLLSVAFLLCAGAAEARAQFDYFNGWDGQLFASYIVATATMRPDDSVAVPNTPGEEGESEAEPEAPAGEEQGLEESGDAAGPVELDGEPEEFVLGDPKSMRLLGVAVTAAEENTPIVVEIEAPGVIEVSRWSGVLEKADTEYSVFPPLRFKFKELIGNAQTVPVAVTYRVWLGDADAVEHTANILLRSINDCPRVILHSNDDIEDLSYMFAAYVNEQHPFVDKVLREALNSGIVDTFDGYQSGNPEAVIRQVYAIWDALSRRDVRYSNITATAATNQMVISQHVRFLDQSINNAQANCVDGSTLLASLLRKIEIETALILMPGHCYLAFAVDPKGEHWMGLETTLLGAKNVDVPPDVESDKIVGPKLAKESSWLTFRFASATGNKNLVEQMPKFEDKETLESLAYQFISVSKSRRRGIVPIAYDSKEVMTSLGEKSK